LTEALSMYRSDVGDVTIAMVELGENTGNMSESLLKLAQILEEIRDNRKKFKSALRYPIIVIIAISIAFTILMVYVVPKFKEIFAKFHSQLPLPTRILLFLEEAINTYGWYILSFIILSIVTIKFLYVNNEEFKRNYDKFILKLYLFGKIIYNATMYRFTMIFTQLIAAGIPIADALDTAVLTVDNTTLKDKLASVAISVKRGMSLSEAFSDTGLFQGMLLQMISAGERSGTLDTMLEKVSDYFKMRFDEIVDNISSYIEPILIGFIAVMVLMMALGIFLPMWDLASAVKHG
ncbi:MAG: type II secretion system F family protein, partial [Epsilonproteobacteria bacterium]|nr:type II secretion system F family protein [Campylobacterota bacterium]